MSAFPEQRGRLIVSERSQGRCELCGATGDGVHHRLKRSAGGSWSPANLLRLCGSGTTGCHGRIEAEPAAAKALGLWLERQDDPDQAPALCRPTMWPLAWWQPLEDGTLQWAAEATDNDRHAYRTLLALTA